MGEPLVDGLTVLTVLLNVAAVAVIRWNATAGANAADAASERARQFNVIGQVLLGLGVAPLLWRWIVTFKSLPADGRIDSWRWMLLITFCGAGVAAAVKVVTANRSRERWQSFLMVGGCCVAVLAVAAQWDWTMLVLAVVVGTAWFLWRTQWWQGTRPTPQRALRGEQEVVGSSAFGRPACRTPPEGGTTNLFFLAYLNAREPVIVVLSAAALLLLILGTWNHVLDRETHRQTRSARYSAWPRATALQDAWERTDWIAKPDDAESARRVEESASREKRIVVGLGFLLSVVASVSWSQSRCDLRVLLPISVNSEADHVD